ncbi:M28 family peptidase [candidate division KSB1 bacterium]
MNRTKCFLLLAIFLFACGTARYEDPETVMDLITADNIFEINKILASPEMEGRLAGTEGYNKAAQWTADRFKEWGLKPVYNNNFLQPFKVRYNEMRETSFSLILPGENVNEDQRTVELEMYKDFCPTLYSGFGNVKTEVVFAGFGITDLELGWDDYSGVDVKGKIVAIFNGTPQVQGKDFSKYSERVHKLVIASEHEAAGLILINMVVVSGSGEYQEGLPMVMVGNEVARMLFEHSGLNVNEVREELRTGKHHSFETGVLAQIDAKGAHHSDAETYNVVGMIEGSDPELKEEYIVFGGHLDHLGPWPVLHPGASDNASGSAVVIGLANAFSLMKDPPKRSIVFVLFGAEELGLLGSKYFVNNLPDFPSIPVLMSNHDMNGVGNALNINGGKTYPDMYEIILEVNAEFSVNENITAGEISAEGGNSDYAPFLRKGIPAYNNSVRGGKRYGVHTAEDNISVIDPQILEDIVRLYFMAGYRYANK